jgi:hypothetical protein
MDRGEDNFVIYAVVVREDMKDERKVRKVEENYKFSRALFAEGGGVYTICGFEYPPPPHPRLVAPGCHCEWCQLNHVILQDQGEQ